jgi:type VI secretion system protein VasG
VDYYKLDRGRLLSELAGAINGFRKNETDMPGVANPVIDLLDRGWHYATLFFGETQIRTGHLLVAGLKSNDIRRALNNLSQEFAKVNVEALAAERRAIWAGSDEETMRPMDGSGLVGAGTDGADQASPKGTTPLDRFSQDLTAKAKSGEMDPILGRDEEIRQLIDVLMRRRQNNPILTGEAGVGKTAVVEGFAQRIAAGDVPPPLRNVRLCALDIGLMQAGASMKGEFEQRLRSVIDEVQSSPTPIILFIDEAHTLIGAGGAAGTGDAANLLKPPLARGTLRTIAATTWAEYRQYIEKDPALTRRFQPIQIDEPDVETCCVMLRGLLGPMEKHHGVRISDAAIVAAVNLSHRYIPSRQLPDKAVSLLDTASARVAISQSATPALIEDARVAITAREAEKSALVSDRDLGIEDGERTAAIDSDIAALKEKLTALEADWAKEQELVKDIRSIRDILSEPKEDQDPDAKRAELRGKFETLEGINPEKRMVYAHVDQQSVASVVSDWTGIPVGRMMRDEIETVL